MIRRFSYATSKPAANWLGFPGAVIADLSFQVLGLGIIVLLLPPALWGWSLIRRRVPARICGSGCIAWIAATVLATGVLAFIAAPASWPLPTGLGGLIGAGFTNLAALVTGATIRSRSPPSSSPSSSPRRRWRCSGSRLASAPCPLPDCPPRRQGRPARARPTTISRPRAAFSTSPSAALVHLFYAGQTAFRRASRQRPREARPARGRSRRVARWRRRAQHGRTRARRRSVMATTARTDTGRRAPHHRADARAGSFEDDYPAEADADEDDRGGGAALRPHRRACRSVPRTGRRAAREAQGSLLEDEDRLRAARTQPARRAPPQGHVRRAPARAARSHGPPARRRARGFRRQGRHHQCPPRPGRHALRARAGPRHQVEPRHLARRRHRPLDERHFGPRRGRPRPQRHRHRTAQREPRDGLSARDAGLGRISRR